MHPPQPGNAIVTVASNGLQELIVTGVVNGGVKLNAGLHTIPAMLDKLSSLTCTRLPQMFTVPYQLYCIGELHVCIPMLMSYKQEQSFIRTVKANGIIRLQEPTL